jgi:large subunit ribosomal protein L20
MTRIKPGVTAHHRHKKVLTLAKGYSQGRRKLVRIANETVMKSLAYAYRDRRARKGDMRRLWIQRINAAARMHGMSYSQFMAALRERGVRLNRKVLADLAVRDLATFGALAGPQSSAARAGAHI